ncbi:RHS repeat domain-containing protein [Cyanobacterium aponinum UTEX 3222]|uniref:RHS repeat domain-containing protein n=1 Tax=Cyanobacterium aponinum TaxID=379064 RepID=UPI003090D6E7|nr:RHS repeat domain-containing protein [Cyanobacterium aponinum UTEX 3222]
MIHKKSETQQPTKKITKVIDPSGNEIEYDYDRNGDLIAVTDREDNTTRFGYDDVRVHFLDEIIDPLGRTGVRTEYNEDSAIVSCRLG